MRVCLPQSPWLVSGRLPWSYDIPVYAKMISAGSPFPSWQVSEQRQPARDRLGKAYECYRALHINGSCSAHSSMTVVRCSVGLKCGHA